MKKLILSSSVLLVCLLLYIYYKTIKDTYVQNFNELAESWGSHCMPYIDYIFFEYPQTFEEIRLSLENDFDYSYYQYYIYKYVRDYLSKETHGFFHYIPLYNHENMKREGLILLSAGIDGKINNRYDWSDTLYIRDFQNIDDIQKKIKLYDFDKLTSFDTVIWKRKVYFNIFKYFFGRKDILIDKRNLIFDYKFQVKETYELEELMKNIEKLQNFTDKGENLEYRKIFGYKGTFSKDTIIGDDRYVYFQHNDFIFRNKLYEGTKDIIPSDTIILVGTLISFDQEEKIFDFIYCIQVEEEINYDYHLRAILQDDI